MSFETWKDEFFINDLKKWEGLKHENLEKHGLEKGTGFLNPIGTIGVSRYPNQFSKIIDSSSCSMCFRYYYGEEDHCINCPIYNKMGTDCRLQWLEWVKNNNADPMIELLRQIPEASVSYTEIKGFLDDCGF